MGPAEEAEKANQSLYAELMNFLNLEHVGMPELASLYYGRKCAAQPALDAAVATTAGDAAAAVKSAASDYAAQGGGAATTR